MSYLTELSDKVCFLSDNPGVYLMKDYTGAVIYVGKAKSLKKRVWSYFQKAHDSNPKTAVMVSKIFDFETIVTPTEKDALILENSLIKKHHPRYNVVFRDDKEYPYLKISTNEKYPSLSIVRRPHKDGALYFGPFASAHSVKETLRFLQKNFLIRKCNEKVLKKQRPCIYFQLGQCLAPCCRQVSESIYKKAVKEMELFLAGRSSQVVRELKLLMEQKAELLKFEEAAKIRDRVIAIERTLEKQSVVSLDMLDRDIFAFTGDNQQMALTAVFVRGGRIIGSRNFHFKDIPVSDIESLNSFITQYYYEGAFVPDEIVVPVILQDRDALEEWLCEKKGKKIKISTSSRGFKRDILHIAKQNSEIFLQKAKEAVPVKEDILKNIQKKLSLSNYPSRIECFDISNLTGKSPSGSMAVFKDGLPAKECYRKFGVKTVSQQDDYAMMKEVLTRRLKRAGDPGWEVPDLILVDGGKGQLGVLNTVIKETGFDSVDTAAIAKPKQDGEREKIFIPLRKNPVILPGYSPEILLLKRLRDEAHRFAVSYHKKLRKNKEFNRDLESVKGIGRKKALCLLNHFGNLENVRNASQEELCQTRFLTDTQGKAVYRYFHSTD